MRGTVKYFDKTKGWGFITGDDQKDYFVHQTDIQMQGFRTLDEGDIVEFEAENSERGSRAVKVNPILTLGQMEEKAKKDGLHLVPAKDHVLGIAGWLIADSSSVLQAGETPMSLEELADCFAQ